MRSRRKRAAARGAAPGGPARDDLWRLLDPRTIAVIGASETPGSPGRIVFELLQRSGRPLVPVNLKRSSVFGSPAYPDIESVPGETAIDLAVITIPAAAAVLAAEACARRDVPFVVVVAGGFAESGPEGRGLEERLRAIPRSSGTRILGPNSLGLFVPESGIDTIFVEHGDQALAGGGGVAFVSQSGSVGVESLGLASNSGFGMRAFVGLGNKCDLDELDFLRHFGQDPETTCLAFYVESLDAGRAFLEESRRVSRAKPVIALKAGRTSSGAQAVSSHTGRLAGSDRVIGGAFRQHGVQRALDDEELCDAAKTLAALPPPAGHRVAVLTAAGGYGVMSTDYIEAASRRAPLTMATLQPRTRERIRAASFPFAACDNPVDLTASATDAMFGEALDALLADPGVDILLCIAFFAPPTISDDLVEVIADRARGAAKPILVFTQYGPFTDEHLRRFYRAGVVGFPSVSRAVRAARFLAERAEILRSLASDAPGCVDPTPAGEAPGAGGTSPGPSTDRWLAGLRVPGRPDEIEAKELLARWGIAIPAGRRLRPDDSLEPLPESPADLWVLKICSPEILHKTEAGGVSTNLGVPELAAQAARLRESFPGANLLVEAQVRYTGPELILGAVVDPALGPAVMVGAGGVFTELYRDVSFRLAPCSLEECRRMLGELLISPALQGYRGIRMDTEALAWTINRISCLVVELGVRFRQIDVNPIVFADGRWVALDARILLG